MTGSYFTVKKEYGPQEIKEKGSRFIAFLYPVTSGEEAEALIQKLRKKFHQASHVCFAYRIGGEKEEYFRCSDDGEPSGTAGLPIYNEIKSKNYLNVLAAVVRYFGGTKLGTGGLARAYARSARGVLDTSEKVVVTIKKEVTVFFPYDFIGEMMQIVNRFCLDILARKDTAPGIHMKLAIPKSMLNEVSRMIVNKSSGKIELQSKKRES